MNYLWALCINWLLLPFGRSQHFSGLMSPFVKASQTVSLEPTTSYAIEHVHHFTEKRESKIFRNQPEARELESDGTRI